MKSIRKSAKGFTFVELIIVMAIIAVLTATLVIAVGAFLRDKKYDDANAKAEVLYRAIQIKLNKYDAEQHKTNCGGDESTIGIAKVPRDNATGDLRYICVGNFEVIAKNEDTIGCASHLYATNDTGAAGWSNWDHLGEGTAEDANGYLVDFDMGDTIRTIYTKRNNANVTWNPSWMAVINKSTYTVEYVLYSEDEIELQNYFFDRCGSDFDGYYVDVYEQQSATERARLDYNVVGCYPMQSFYS